MIENLLAVLIFINNPDSWKDQVYERKYKQVVMEFKDKQSATLAIQENTGSISWYAKGLKNPEALTAACWSEYPKGTRFRITYNGNSVVVVCNDRGHFREMGRMLDLSSGAFKALAPLNRGILRGAKIQVIK